MSRTQIEWSGRRYLSLSLVTGSHGSLSETTQIEPGHRWDLTPITRLWYSVFVPMFVPEGRGVTPTFLSGKNLLPAPSLTPFRTLQQKTQLSPLRGTDELVQVIKSKI